MVFFHLGTKVAICLAWAGLVVSNCPAQNKSPNLNLQLKSRDNLILAVSGQKNELEIQPKLTVFVSLSEVCMISQYYSRVLEEMAESKENSSLIFKGVFPNPFSTDSTIAEFQKEWRLHFPLYRDPNGLFCENNFIQVTPEVLVVDSAFAIVYRGRIDDFYFAIGRFRTKTNHHDLQNAISQYREGKKVSPAWVQPIGCIIDGRLWKKK